MGCEPIRAEDLPRWVPGKTVLASDGQGWRGVKLRSYRYTPLDVEVPALQDFMVVAYRQGPTPMNRRFDGHWHHENLVPGDVSLLTRAMRSHWNWTCGIEVIHIYLTLPLVAQICEEMFDRDISDVHFRDILKTPDPIMFRCAIAIADEAADPRFGGSLYVDAIARQMCVHAIRNYSTVSFAETAPPKGLSEAPARRVAEYIEANLEGALTVAELAGVVNHSSRHFLRQFKWRFGVTPHQYVTRLRLERAQRLLATSKLPIKAIAARVGYTDQPHMTRMFRLYLGTTPKAYRVAVRS